MAAALGGVLLLAGCSGEDAAAPAPVSRPSATPSATAPPTPSPPTVPPEARGTSDAAAITFVEHYVDVLNRTAATLDTTALQRLSSPDCRSCAWIVQKTKDIQGAGGQLKGGAWTIVETTPLVEDDVGSTHIQTVIDYAAEEAIERPGAEPSTSAAGRAVFVFEIQYGSGWQVHEIASATR